MSNDSFLLYHYDASPFSEKIRALLGHTALPWHSVNVSPMLPRPELMDLTGGYRRIPVAQVGADIYCDTKIIAEEILARSGVKLNTGGDPAEVLELAEWADRKLFAMCLVLAATGGTRVSIPEFGKLDWLKFGLDRLRMGWRGKLPLTTPKKAKIEVTKFVARFDAQLGDGFAFGDTPSIADFCVWHPLWFAERAVRKLLPQDSPTLAWMRRMHDLGHGTPQSISLSDAVDVARDASPATPSTEGELPDGIRKNQQVNITPTDYGRIPTSGILVGWTPTRWAISRVSKHAGTVHVHLPRAGYEIRET